MCGGDLDLSFNHLLGVVQAASIPGWDGGSTRYGGSTVRARSGSDFLYYVKGTR